MFDFVVLALGFVLFGGDGRLRDRLRPHLRPSVMNLDYTLAAAATVGIRIYLRQQAIWKSTPSAIARPGPESS